MPFLTSHRSGTRARTGARAPNMTRSEKSKREPDCKKESRDPRSQLPQRRTSLTGRAGRARPATGDAPGPVPLTVIEEW